MISGQLNIVYNCPIKTKFHSRIPWYAELNRKVFSFFLESLVYVLSLMSTSRPFHALGAATENARSDETSLKRGTTRSCLPAERREARPDVGYGSYQLGKIRRAGPLTAWCTKRQSLNLIPSEISNQWYIASGTWSRCPKAKHKPTEKQRWGLSGVEQALTPVNEAAQSCSNPVVWLLMLIQVVWSHRVQDSVVLNVKRRIEDAGPGNLGHVCFHREMRINADPEIPDDVDWLDDIGANSETSQGRIHLSELNHRSNPY